MSSDFKPSTLKPRIYSVKDTRRLIGHGHTKTYQLVSQGILDARKAGGKTMITAESIERYIESLPRADIHMAGYGPAPADGERANPGRTPDARVAVLRRRREQPRQDAINQPPDDATP